MAQGQDSRDMRAIGIWLGIVALLIVVMILVGGATRLTELGLSITEWRPLTGAIPPLSADAWLDEFIRYQGIPEYQIVNQGMTIDEFKTIYLWEWAHRNVGRLIGLAFLLPFVWFALRGRLSRPLAWRLAGIFALGGLQAFAGWYMVRSGLTEGVDVSQYRLAIHLGLAFLILGAILWTLFGLGLFGGRPAENTTSGQRLAAGALSVLVFAQVLAGALVAGLRAGFAYNTWPLMEGEFVPSGIFTMSPWYVNFGENAATVQFDHRMIAYALIVAAIVHAMRLRDRAAARSAWAIVHAGLLQVAIGIATLLTEVPLVLGLAHQLGAVLVFAAALRHLHVMVQAPRAAGATYTAASA